MKYAAFLRWILFIGLIFVGVFFTSEHRILNRIWTEDFTRISLVIGGVFIYSTFRSGYSAAKLMQYDNSESGWNWDYHEKTHDNNEHLASYCSGLGMLGTVVGMIAMMSSIGTMDLANIDLTDFALSMSTALYTTGVGLFANLLIRIQNHSNWSCLEKVDAAWETEKQEKEKLFKMVYDYNLNIPDSIKRDTPSDDLD